MIDEAAVLALLSTVAHGSSPGASPVAAGEDVDAVSETGGAGTPKDGESAAAARRSTFDENYLDRVKILNWLGEQVDFEPCLFVFLYITHTAIHCVVFASIIRRKCIGF